MTKDLVFITGATGFVGKNLIQKLQHEKIVCLLKDRNDTVVFKGNITIIYGDLADPGLFEREDVLELLDKTKTFIHLGAVIKSKSKSEFKRVNVDSTHNIAKICSKKKIKLVFISSSLADPKLADAYGDTKMVSEKDIKLSGCNYTIIRPQVIYAPNDTKNLASLARLIKKYRIINIVGDGRYRLQPIHVNDVCYTIMQAMHNAKMNKKTYMIGGKESLSYNEIITIIVDHLNIKTITLHIPIWLVWIPVAVYQTLSSWPVINTEQLRYWTKDRVCDNTIPKQDFNLDPVSFRDGVKDIL